MVQSRTINWPVAVIGLISNGYNRHMNIKEMLQVGVTTSLHLPVRTSDYRAIKAHIEPFDLDLYRTLLPEPLTMPGTPKLLFEISEVSPQWHEGILSIACCHGDKEGWHGLYWAIDSYFPCVFGRLYGYPKFMADSMTLSATDKGWLGLVEHKGKTHLRVDYHRLSKPDEAAGDIKSPSEEKPFFLQCPPERGPHINRLTQFDIKAPEVVYKPGTAHVTFDGDERYNGLLPPEGATGPAQIIEKIGWGFGFLYSRRMQRPS
tara:strand:- start:150906 stop:151688 length:783 start_codon:yes stop_codon:yes gene_type:complete